LHGLLLFMKKNIERDGTFKIISFDCVLFRTDFLELDRFRRMSKMLLPILVRLFLFPIIENLNVRGIVQCH